MIRENIIERNLDRISDALEYSQFVVVGAIVLHVCGVEPSPLGAIFAFVGGLPFVVFPFAFKQFCAEATRRYGDDTRPLRPFGWFFFANAVFLLLMLIPFIAFKVSTRWSGPFLVVFFPFLMSFPTYLLLGVIARNPSATWAKLIVAFCYNLGGAPGIYLGYKLFPEVEEHLPHLCFVTGLKVLIEQHILGRPPKYYDAPEYFPVAEKPEEVSDVPVRIQMRAGVEVKRPGKET